MQVIPPHDWLHITTPLATGKKPPGEKTNFPPSKTSECAGVLGSSSPPCLCQQHSPPCSGLAEATRHPVLSPVRYSTVVCWMQPEAALRFTRSISHILTHLRGAGMLHRQPTQSQRSGDELSMETSQEPRVSIFIYYFFSLSLCLKAICSMCGGPTASRRSRCAPECAQGGGTGFIFLCEVLFASTITQTVTSFTRKHWRVLRSGSNLFLHGLRAGGSPFPSSSIIRVLQPLHLQHREFSVPFHKLLSPLLFRPQFC